MEPRSRMRRINLLLALALLPFIHIGCGKRTEPNGDESQAPQAQTTTPPVVVQDNHAKPIAILPPSEPPAGALAESLALWQQGRRDEAVEAFVKLDFSAGVLFDAPSPLALTERDFQLLKADDREAALTTAMSQTADISVLCTEVIHKGQTSGNRAYIDAVSKLADRILSDKDSLALLLNTAMGLKENVEEVSQ